MFSPTIYELHCIQRRYATLIKELEGIEGFAAAFLLTMAHDRLASKDEDPERLGFAFFGSPGGSVNLKERTIQFYESYIFQEMNRIYPNWRKYTEKQFPVDATYKWKITKIYQLWMPQMCKFSPVQMGHHLNALLREIYRSWFMRGETNPGTWAIMDLFHDLMVPAMETADKTFLAPYTHEIPSDVEGGLEGPPDLDPEELAMWEGACKYRLQQLRDSVCKKDQYPNDEPDEVPGEEEPEEDIFSRPFGEVVSDWLLPDAEIPSSFPRGRPADSMLRSPSPSPRDIEAFILPESRSPSPRADSVLGKRPRSESDLDLFDEFGTPGSDMGYRFPQEVWTPRLLRNGIECNT